MHSCPDCGIEHGEPEPVIIEDNSDKAAAVEGEAAIEIARLETGRDVAVAKIVNRSADEETAAVIAGLQARVDVLEAAALPPEPEVIEMPEPEPEPEPEVEEVTAPPEVTAPKTGKKSKGWWDGYR